LNETPEALNEAPEALHERPTAPGGLGFGANLPGQALPLGLGQQFAVPLLGELPADVRRREHGRLLSGQITGLGLRVGRAFMWFCP
jgi:hypothetical protein